MSRTHSRVYLEFLFPGVTQTCVRWHHPHFGSAGVRVILSSVISVPRTVLWEEHFGLCGLSSRVPSQTLRGWLLVGTLHAAQVHQDSRSSTRNSTKCPRSSQSTVTSPGGHTCCRYSGVPTRVFQQGSQVPPFKGDFLNE